MIFIPENFSLKWETESLKSRDKGVSESQPLTNTPARFMHNAYGTHTCKYLVNWRNYAKRDLNLKCPNWGSFGIPKLVYLHAELQKAGRAFCDWYLEASKTESGRVTSQEINQRLL